MFNLKKLSTEFFVITFLFSLSSVVIAQVNVGTKNPGGVDIGTQNPGGVDIGTTKQGSKGTSISLPSVLGIKTIQQLIDRIINFLLLLGSPIAIGMILWAAYQILTAGANPDNVTAGRKTITYAVIGYIILLTSKGIVLIIQKILGAQ